MEAVFARVNAGMPCWLSRLVAHRDGDNEASANRFGYTPTTNDGSQSMWAIGEIAEWG